MHKCAFIFDMDGVVVDNIPYHRQVWRDFFIEHGKKFSADYFDNHINGKRGAEIFKAVFGTALTDEQLLRLDREREARYRTLYAPHIKPLGGLRKFLAKARRMGIPIALATSAPPEGVRFVLDKTGLRKFFDCIVDARGVKRGKPHPDMFLKAARKLKIPPKRCVVFEDAVLGVQAGVAAKMPTVAVMTSYSRRQLPAAKVYLRNFANTTPAKIIKQISLSS